MRILCNDTVEQAPIDKLTPAPGHARTHSKAQQRRAEKLIKKLGWTNPILVDENYQIIAGHLRLDVAKNLGLTEVPCLRLIGMTEAEKKAYVIADNRLAEQAGWDRDLLALELGEIIGLNVDIDHAHHGFRAMLPARRHRSNRGLEPDRAQGRSLAARGRLRRWLGGAVL